MTIPFFDRFMEPDGAVLPSLPNLRFKTLGGCQFWADVHYEQGWRIQENVVTGHFRLLDSHDVRHAWGGYEACAARLADLTVAPSQDSEHLVILLHGLGRTRRSMNGLKRRLTAAGYKTVSLTYPSTRGDAAGHARRLGRLMTRLNGVARVSFVTHSFGGIVLRHVLASDAPWRGKIDVHGAVLLAPPNRGSRMAEWLKRNILFRLIAGPAGQCLATSEAHLMPPVHVRHLVVAGARGDGRGWNPLLSGDDDGVVSVAETLPEMNGQFRAIRSGHTFIMNRPDAQAFILDFLAARR